MLGLMPNSQDEHLILYANTANYYYTHSYRNGTDIDNTKARYSKEEERIFDKLSYLVIEGNLTELESSEELETFNINYRERKKLQTLLHYAYMCNQPEIVEFLLKNGADDRIPDKDGEVPLGLAHPEYGDSSNTVVKEIVSRYIKRNESTNNDTHILFDTILEFIHEKNWKYHDTEGVNKLIPFRDRANLACLGLPSLSYHVNCFDLTEIFIRATRQIGINAEKVKYHEYKSIRRDERRGFNIEGEMAMFDGSHPSAESFEWDTHYVAQASGWHYDLTLMCKYQDRDAVLRRTQTT